MGQHTELLIDQNYLERSLAVQIWGPNKLKYSLLAKSYDVIVMQMIVHCIHRVNCPALDQCEPGQA